jgi:hypothetical protein
MRRFRRRSRRRTARAISLISELKGESDALVFGPAEVLGRIERVGDLFALLA